MVLAVMAVYLFFCIRAVMLVCEGGEGIEVPVWIIVIGCVPLLGIVGAFLYFGRKTL